MSLAIPCYIAKSLSSTITNLAIFASHSAANTLLCLTLCSACQTTAIFPFLLQSLLNIPYYLSKVFFFFSFTTFIKHHDRTAIYNSGLNCSFKLSFSAFSYTKYILCSLTKSKVSFVNDN